MAPVAFDYLGSPVSLAAGESFHRPPVHGFSDTNPGDMRSIIDAVKAGAPWRDEIDRRFSHANPWLHQIITSPRRRAFFSLLRGGPHRILDIGCGWGQMALPLAADGHAVVALEPSPLRLEFVETAARQEGLAGRISFVGADFLECDFKPAFDVVLSIGVLEWVGVFRAGGSPADCQRSFLAHARASLVSGGALLVGIENRIGAKYLLGCPDDHLGVSGIACLPADMAARRWKADTGRDLRCLVHTESELRGLLREAGFSSVQTFAAFPDYKLPEVIIPLDGGERQLDERILGGAFVAEHNGFNGAPLADEFQDRLRAFYVDAARLGIARHFVPSFFVVAR
jgi:SAM-dependent methyltransferase